MNQKIVLSGLPEVEINMVARKVEKTNPHTRKKTTTQTNHQHHKQPTNKKPAHLFKGGGGNVAGGLL